MDRIVEFFVKKIPIKIALTFLLFRYFRSFFHLDWKKGIGFGKSEKKQAMSV